MWMASNGQQTAVVTMQPPQVDDGSGLAVLTAVYLHFSATPCFCLLFFSTCSLILTIQSSFGRLGTSEHHMHDPLTTAGLETENDNNGHRHHGNLQGALISDELQASHRAERAEMALELGNNPSARSEDETKKKLCPLLEMPPEIFMKIFSALGEGYQHLQCTREYANRHGIAGNPDHLPSYMMRQPYKDWQGRFRNMASFVRTCKAVHQLLNGELYREDSEHHYSAAVVWAARNGEKKTMELSLAYERFPLGIHTLAQPVQGVLDTVWLPGGESWFKSAAPQTTFGTAMHWAAAHGHLEIVNFLISKGARVRSFWGSGLCRCRPGPYNIWFFSSPMHVAICNSHAEVALRLLEIDPQAALYSASVDASALDPYADFSITPEIPEDVGTLDALNVRISQDFDDHEGTRTFQQDVISSRQPRLIRSLSERFGWDMNKVDRDGTLPPIFSVMAKTWDEPEHWDLPRSLPMRHEVMKALLDSGGDPNRTHAWPGQSQVVPDPMGDAFVFLHFHDSVAPFFFACHQQYWRTAATLLDNGAKLYNELWNSPHVSAKEPYFALLARWFLEHVHRWLTPGDVVESTNRSDLPWLQDNLRQFVQAFVKASRQTPNSFLIHFLDQDKTCWADKLCSITEGTWAGFDVLKELRFGDVPAIDEELGPEPEGRTLVLGFLCDQRLSWLEEFFDAGLDINSTCCTGGLTMLQLSVRAFVYWMACHRRSYLKVFGAQEWTDSNRNLCESDRWVALFELLAKRGSSFQVTHCGMTPLETVMTIQGSLQISFAARIVASLVDKAVPGAMSEEQRLKALRWVGQGSSICR